MKAELLPLNGDPPIPLQRSLTVVGRREFCDLVVPHPSLSKRHCLLVRTEGLLIVRDLVSTNGTKVNGQRVAWAALMPNDRLTLGRVKYKVYVGPDDLPAPSERPASSRPQVAASPHDEDDEDDAFIPVAPAAPRHTASPAGSGPDLAGDVFDDLEILDDPPPPSDDEFIIDLP